MYIPLGLGSELLVLLLLGLFLFLFLEPLGQPCFHFSVLATQQQQISNTLATH
jgi:hypothetical protein